MIIYQSMYFICFCGNYSTWLIRSVSSFNLNYSTPKKKIWENITTSDRMKNINKHISFKVDTFREPPSTTPISFNTLPIPNHPPTHTPDVVNFNIPVTVNVYLVYMLCLPIDRNMTFAPGPSQRLLNIDGIKILYMIDEGIFMHLYYTHTPTHSGVKVLRPNC